MKDKYNFHDLAHINSMINEKYELQEKELLNKKLNKKINKKMLKEAIFLAVQLDKQRDWETLKHNERFTNEIIDDTMDRLAIYRRVAEFLKDLAIEERYNEYE